MNMVYSLRKGLWTIGLLHRAKRRKPNPKEKETEAQSGGNGTMMVLPLNDALNGSKRDEYCALSSQRFVDYQTPSSYKEEETESQREGNGSPNWRKRYKDGATFKRHAKRIKIWCTPCTSICGLLDFFVAQRGRN